MTSFKDRNGKAWVLDLNIGMVRRIKAVCKIDLGNIVKFGEKDGGLSQLEQLADDSDKLCALFWTMCEAQVVAAGLDEEKFFSGFDGDTIDAATAALIDELVNFSRPAQRAILKKVVELSRQAQEQAVAGLLEAIDSGDLERDLNSSLKTSSAPSRE